MPLPREMLVSSSLAALNRDTINVRDALTIGGGGGGERRTSTCRRSSTAVYVLGALYPRPRLMTFRTRNPNAMLRLPAREPQLFEIDPCARKLRPSGDHPVELCVGVGLKRRILGGIS